MHSGRKLIDYNVVQPKASPNLRIFVVVEYLSKLNALWPVLRYTIDALWPTSPETVHADQTIVRHCFHTIVLPPPCLVVGTHSAARGTEKSHKISYFYRKKIDYGENY